MRIYAHESFGSFAARTTRYQPSRRTSMRPRKHHFAPQCFGHPKNGALFWDSLTLALFRPFFEAGSHPNMTSIALAHRGSNLAQEEPNFFQSKTPSPAKSLRFSCASPNNNLLTKMHLTCHIGEHARIRARLTSRFPLSHSSHCRITWLCSPGSLRRGELDGGSIAGHEAESAPHEFPLP